jgi:arylsulfatase A-like enzyme
MTTTVTIMRSSSGYTTLSSSWRRPLPVFAGFLFAVLLLFLSVCAMAQSRSEKPNVLFIVVDDMNSWSLLNNYPVLKVPAIRKLMSESLYFENATCAASICVPSRASFFSGKYPHHSGVYRNVANAWNNSKLLTEVEALPELFKRSGYTTWGGGKTFHVPLGEREKKMFDNQVFHGGYGPFAKNKGSWNEVKPWEGPDTDFTDVVNADAASAFLAGKHENPFFMFYGLYRPHTPYTAPRRFHDLYEGVRFPDPPGYLKNDLQDVPEQGKALSRGLTPFKAKGLSTEEGFQTYLRAYCANYSFADWNVGRVLEALDKSAYADNTIVIFVSDNGFHNGTKDHWTKQTLWEQADGIPFLIRLPERKAQTCSQTVSLIDLYPTLVEYCGLGKPRQELDGKSLVPVFANRKQKWERPGFTSVGENYSSVRGERYRYIRYPDGSEELYDHRHDPYEHNNLATKKSLRPVIATLSAAIPARFEKALSDEEKPAAVQTAERAEKKTVKKKTETKGKKRNQKMNKKQ